jgi:hypothetical protein
LDVYNPDVFICTDGEGERIRELYQPVSSIVIPQVEAYQNAMELREALKLSPVVPEPVLSIAYKLMTANKLKSIYEIENNFVYDVVIVSRFDVKFAEVQEIKDLEDNTFYVPFIDAYPVNSDPTPGLHWGGYSAHICWAKSHIIDQITSIYFHQTDWLHLATVAKKDWGQNPEHVLKYYCDENNIKAEFIHTDMMLIRGTSKSPLAFNHHPLKKYPKFAKA